MDILNIAEHLKCFNYDHSKNPQIEIINYTKGESIELLINISEIVFLLKGRIKYTFHLLSGCSLKRGEMLFLPVENRFVRLSVESDATMMIFRLYNPIKLCESYLVERLFDPKEFNTSGMFVDHADKPMVLDINQRMFYFVNGVINNVTDGIKCKHFFEMKIKEFFMLLRAYYPKSEIKKFLYPVLSSDTAFSEYVKNNRNKFSTVIALAKSMHLTQRQFVRRFRKVFNRTPYSWMKESRTSTMRSEITTTVKPLKQISHECGFSSIAQFTRYCKKEVGMTPMELRNKYFRN